MVKWILQSRGNEYVRGHVIGVCNKIPDLLRDKGNLQRQGSSRERVLSRDKPG